MGTQHNPPPPLSDSSFLFDDWFAAYGPDATTGVVQPGCLSMAEAVHRTCERLLISYDRDFPLLATLPSRHRRRRRQPSGWRRLPDRLTPLHHARSGSVSALLPRMARETAGVSHDAHLVAGVLARRTQGVLPEERTGRLHPPQHRLLHERVRPRLTAADLPGGPARRLPRYREHLHARTRHDASLRGGGAGERGIDMGGQTRPLDQTGFA